MDDDYFREIQELQIQIAGLEERDEDPEVIQDLKQQLQVLSAIYQEAIALLDQGRTEPELRRRLELRGFGEWNLDNVYAYVYETAIDLPARNHAQFVRDISGYGYAEALRWANPAGPLEPETGGGSAPVDLN